VLDDLGLAAALEGAARAARSDGLDVEVAIESQVGYGRSERPPAAVEIAIFRVVQEALTNAVRHSGATHVVVGGRISPTRIDVAVLDDGSGIREERVAAAMRAGHLGIASMRRRAESIDAVFEMSRREPNGTRVGVRWSA
jgi:signal transduction histidine kinase